MEERFETYEYVIDELKSNLGSQTSREELNKNKAVSELITTEQSYNVQLSSLSEALQNEALKNTPFLKQFIEPILKLKDLSDRLLKNLNSAINSKLNERDRGILKENRFHLLMDFTEVLHFYAQLYVEYIKKSKTNPQEFQVINNFLKEKHALDFPGHLIVPIQRGARYKLLIEEIKKQDTSLNAENRAECEKMIRVLEGILKLVDAALKIQTAKVEEKSSLAAWWETYQVGDIARSVITAVKTGVEDFKKGFEEEMNTNQDDSSSYKF